VSIEECEKSIDLAKAFIGELDDLETFDERLGMADGIVRNLSNLSYCAEFVQQQNDVDLKRDYLITVNALRTYCVSLELGDLKMNSAFSRIQEGMPDYDLSFDRDGVVERPKDLVI